MIVLPPREQLILFITFVVIFIVFWIDEKRLKDKDHILNKAGPFNKSNPPATDT